MFVTGYPKPNVRCSQLNVQAGNELRPGTFVYLVSLSKVYFNEARTFNCYANNEMGTEVLKIGRAHV